MAFSTFLKVIWARKWFITSFVFVICLLIGVKSIFAAKQYEATASIIINVNGKDPITGAMVPTLMQPAFLATQVEIVKSINVALKVVNNLGLSKNPELQTRFAEIGANNTSFDVWLGYGLLQNLQVTPSRQSSIIYITYRSNSSVQSAQLANAFAEAYVQTNLDLKIDPSRRTAAWYTTQVENIKNELALAREELTSYQQETGLLTINEGYTVESQRIGQLNSQLLSLNTTLSTLETKQITFNNFDPEFPNESSISDPMIDRLKVAYVNSQLEFSEVSNKFSENHPNYVSAYNNMVVKRDSLINEIQSAKAKLSSEIKETKLLIANVEKAIDEQTQLMLSNNKNRDKLKVLVNKVQNTESLLNATTQKLNLFRLEGNSVDTDVSILNRASPPFSASNASLIFTLIATFIFSGIIALFSVLVFEQLNKKIRDKTLIEDSFDIPVLAEIPKIKQA